MDTPQDRTGYVRIVDESEGSHVRIVWRSSHTTSNKGLHVDRRSLGLKFISAEANVTHETASFSVRSLLHKKWLVFLSSGYPGNPKGPSSQ